MTSSTKRQFHPRRGIFAALVVWLLRGIDLGLYAFGGVSILSALALAALWLSGVAPVENPIEITAYMLGGLAVGASMIATARLGSIDFAAARSLSVDVDSSVISVTESPSSAYTICPAKIGEVRVSDSPQSRFLPLTSLVTVLTDEGKEYVLPMRLMESDALAEAIAASAGLDGFRKEGGWGVYYRSGQ